MTARGAEYCKYQLTFTGLDELKGKQVGQVGHGLTHGSEVGFGNDGQR